MSFLSLGKIAIFLIYFSSYSHLALSILISSLVIALLTPNQYFKYSNFGNFK